MSREDPSICYACNTAFSIKLIISNCLAYIQDSFFTRFLNLDAALGPITKKNKTYYYLKKKKTIYLTVFKHYAKKNINIQL